MHEAMNKEIEEESLPKLPRLKSFKVNTDKSVILLETRSIFSSNNNKRRMLTILSTFISSKRVFKQDTKMIIMVKRITILKLIIVIWYRKGC